MALSAARSTESGLCALHGVPLTPSGSDWTSEEDYRLRRSFADPMLLVTVTEIDLPLWVKWTWPAPLWLVLSTDPV
jgi:hypothetical protein